MSSEPKTIDGQSQMSPTHTCADEQLTVRDLIVQASKAGAMLYNGQPVGVLLEDPDNEALLRQKAAKYRLAHQRVLQLFPIPKQLVVILSWGMRAQYRALHSSTTVGELKRQVEAEVKKGLGGRVLKYEFQITGTTTRPNEETPLLSLTNYPYRNVCLDVLRERQLRRRPEIPSVNEHLFRKHLTHGGFQSGVDKKCWRLVGLRWPEAIFALRRKERRWGFEEALVRFQLHLYPQQAPVVDLWDVDEHCRIEPEHWPNWFSCFLVEHSPAFALIAPAPYSFKLLQMSAAIAQRLRDGQSQVWDSSAGIAQCLTRLLTSFRSSRSDVNPSRQIGAQPNSERRICASRSRRRKKIEKMC